MEKNTSWKKYSKNIQSDCAWNTKFWTKKLKKKLVCEKANAGQRDSSVFVCDLPC